MIEVTQLLKRPGEPEIYLEMNDRYYVHQEDDKWAEDDMWRNLGEDSWYDSWHPISQLEFLVLTGHHFDVDRVVIIPWEFMEL